VLEAGPEGWETNSQAEGRSFCAFWSLVQGLAFAAMFWLSCPVYWTQGSVTLHGSYFPGSGNTDTLGPDSYEDCHTAVPRPCLDFVCKDRHLPTGEFQLDLLIAPVQEQGVSSCHPTVFPTSVPVGSGSLETVTTQDWTNTWGRSPAVTLEAPPLFRGEVGVGVGGGGGRVRQCGGNGSCGSKGHTRAGDTERAVCACAWGTVGLDSWKHGVLCILSSCCDKVPEESNLRKKCFTVAHSLRVRSPTAGMRRNWRWQAGRLSPAKLSGAALTDPTMLSPARLYFLFKTFIYAYTIFDDIYFHSLLRLFLKPAPYPPPDFMSSLFLCMYVCMYV
jgi:hypothetical protein